MIDFSWYKELTKPFLSPPSWIFSPVWCILYISIFVSLILYITKKSGQSKIQGYIWFAVQMLLNLLWTPAFFMLKNIGLGLIIISLLDVAVFFNIKKFYEINKISGILLIPYLIWILFATYLNFGFYVLN